MNVRAKEYLGRGIMKTRKPETAFSILVQGRRWVDSFGGRMRPQPIFND